MRFYIQLPFHRTSVNSLNVVSEDMIESLEGNLFLKISARQFERITRDFQNARRRYQIASVDIPHPGDDSEVATLLKPPNDDTDEQITVPS